MNLTDDLSNLPLPEGFPAGGFDAIDSPRPLFEPVGEDEINKGSLAAERPSLLGAAFRTENIVGSYLASEARKVPNDMDAAFDAWKETEGYPDREKHWDKLKGAYNPHRYHAILQDIRREEEDRKALDASPILGTLASAGASIADVTSLIPGGAFVRGAGLGYSVGKTALATGLAAGVGTAAQEAGLQATQQMRSAAESGLAVGGSVVLGGLLGAGAAKLLSHLEWNAAAKKIDDVMREAGEAPQRLADFEAGAQEAATGIPAPAPVAGSVGAAATPRISPEDLDISGSAARAIGKAAAPLNPSLRLAQSPSGEVRAAAERMLKNSVYFSMHDEGRTLGVAAETAMIEHMGAYARAVRAMDEIYSEARKAGLKMREEEFRRVVGRTLRRGDVADPGDAGVWAPVTRLRNEGDDDFAARMASAADPVSRAAQSWRKILFDPLKDQAIATGRLPEDVSVDTAVSYFSRLWQREKLAAQEGPFKELVTSYYDRVLGAEYRRDLDALRNKLDELAASGDADEAAKKLSELERQFYDKWEVERLGQGIDITTGARVDFRDAARMIADEVFDKLTGRNLDSVPGGLSITITARGPLRERTFNVPDALVESFLEDDVSHVGKRYARIVGADVELARNFGDPTLKQTLADIRADYDRLRLGMTDEAELRRLDKRQRADIGDIEALRDLLRGAYAPDHLNQTFDRVVRVAGMANYIRLMGGVVLSSLTDVARVPMVHGMQALGMGPLAARLGGELKRKAIKLSVEEAQLAGNVLEAVQNSRLAAMIDLTDPYRTRTGIEAFMEKATDVASKWNGIRIWTDTMKSWAAVVTQNRVLDGVSRYAELPAKERRYLAFLGIDGNMAERIAAESAAHGQVVENVRVAGSAAWADEGARRAFYGAVNKDVDSIIISPSRGDIPLFGNTPLGRMALQFKSFALASNQRILMRGLQEDQARFWGGVVATSAVGMLISYLKAVESNRQHKLSDNPGYWFGEAIDRSGVLSIGMELSNTAEKLGLYGVKRAAVDLGEVLIPGVSGREGPNRYGSRGKMSALFGPTVGTAEDIATVLSIPEALARDGEVKDVQLNAAKNLVPFGSYPGLRQFMNYVVLPPEGGERLGF